MAFLRTIGGSILDALTLVWVQLINYLPSIIAALVILIIGIFIAKLIGKLVEKVVQSLKLDELIRKINIIQKIEDAGTRVIFSDILGWLVKWFLYVALLIAISEILNLGQFTDFLREIALYLPNVIIAVLVLVAGLVLGDFVDKLVVNILRSSKARLAPLVGAIAKWAIYITAIIAAFEQLGIASELLRIVYTAIAATVAISAGLAFGLGGKEAAKELIEKIKVDFKE